MYNKIIIIVTFLLKTWEGNYSNNMKKQHQEKNINKEMTKAEFVSTAEEKLYKEVMDLRICAEKIIQ